MTHPPLSALPGAMAFLQVWLSDDTRCLTHMTDGLPPSHWIDSVKAAVSRVYATMDGESVKCVSLPRVSYSSVGHYGWKVIQV